jgi:tetraacyldisaccharide 4'-kinase
VQFHIQLKQMVFKSKKPSVLVVCGIAQPGHFINELHNNWEVIATKTYPDHHRFSEQEEKEWLRIIEYKNLEAIVTTCKDAVRIKPLMKSYPQITLVSIPIKVEWTDKDEINKWVDEWLESPIFATQNK